MQVDERHLLYDNASHTVLAIHPNLAAIATVCHATPGSAYFPAFTRFVEPISRWSPHYVSALLRSTLGGDQKPFRRRPANTFDFLSARTEHYPSWTWSPRPKYFRRQKNTALIADFRSRSALAQAQCDALAAMMENLRLAREDVSSGCGADARVAAGKVRQARMFIGAGVLEEAVLRAPYVVAHAAQTNLSLEAAAHDLVLQEDLADDFLAKTEAVRVAFFERILGAKEPGQIPPILDEFIHATSRFSLN